MGSLWQKYNGKEAWIIGMDRQNKNIVKIMICDDDRALRSILQGKIERLCAERGIPCRVRDCDSGEEVLGLLEAGSKSESRLQREWEAEGERLPDILFLDIQMPGRNGMEIAEELRKQHKDTILIFVTALSEYVYEAFDVGAFHYLVKPFSDDKLKEVLGKALQQYEKQQEIAALRRTGGNIQMRSDGKGGQVQDSGENEDAYRNGRAKTAILVKRGGISTRVLLADIIYAEVFNRKVMLHTTGGDIEYYGKLTDLSEQTGEDFYRTHRAYLVNFKYVEKYNATTIWLEKGTAPISKKQYAGFVRQYMQYISRKKDR